MLLFVIDAQTRALASIVEASEYICRGRAVVLSIVDIEPGTSFGGEPPIGAAELKDLNRQRSYLRDIATRHGIPFASSVEAACDRVVQYYGSLRGKRDHPTAAGGLVAAAASLVAADGGGAV